MDEALRLAREAGQAGEVPVGAVALHDGRVVGRGRNAREGGPGPDRPRRAAGPPEAARTLGRWRLTGVTLVVTLEPCAMCAGAMVLARIDRLVYGAADPKAGAVGSLQDLSNDPRLNHRFPVERGLRAEEASALLQDFFRARRTGSESRAGGPSRGAALGPTPPPGNSRSPGLPPWHAGRDRLNPPAESWPSLVEGA